MAFTLTVTHGAGEGEVYTLQSEARLGRTQDNDVVIKDPSSSRSHARVFEKAGRVYVEDLGSANGTMVNGNPIGRPTPLNEGDTISIGDVVLEYTVPVAEETVSAPPEPVEALATVPRSGGRAPVRRVRREEPPPPEPDDEPEPPSDEPEVGDTRAVEVPPPRTLQRRPVSSPARGKPAAVVRRAPDDEDDELDQLTAAEKARRRRELQKSAQGRVELLWSDLSRPARLVLSVVLFGLAAGTLGGVGYLLLPEKVQRKIEPLELRPNTDPVRESFGAGDDVDFERPDMKSFSFVYDSPTRVVGVLHYQARNIAKGEVVVELNGTEVAQVPADLMDTEGRELDVVLPATMLKVGEPNELTFDSTYNPPADDPWRVWNIWVEMIPIPDMSAEEASRRAGEDIEKAAKFYEMRDIGAENLFRSWKTYRDAWLLLEATADRPESLHQIARTRMREIRPELDKKCSSMLVEYKKVMNLRVPDVVRARRLLEDVPTYFPTREHPCHNLSRSLLADLEDLQEM